MNKLILFAAALLTAGSAMAGDGTITFKTVNNQSNMLFYASPTVPDSQKIFTDARLIPEIAEIIKKEAEEEWGGEDPYGDIYSFPEWYVECIVTKGDFSQGDLSVTKAGFTTSPSLPANAKVTNVYLPGRVTGGVTDSLMLAPYVKDVSDTAKHVQHRYLDVDDFNKYIATPTPAYGFLQYNEFKGYKLASTGNGTLLDIPFTTPYVYGGQSMEIMIHITTMDKSISKDLGFTYAQRQAELEVPTVFHGHNIDYVGAHMYQTFAADEKYVDWDYTGTPLEILLNELGLRKNRLPAFQLGFYTNDIRGTVKQEGVVVTGKKVTLYCVTPTGKQLVATQTTNSDGAFEFLNLDHTATYTLNVEDANIPETTTTFGDKAIENDVVAEIELKLLTGVEGISTTKSVTGVTYHNMQGIAATTPFQGLNVVVTQYSDGSKSIAKVIK